MEHSKFSSKKKTSKKDKSAVKRRKFLNEQYPFIPKKLKHNDTEEDSDENSGSEINQQTKISQSESSFDESDSSDSGKVMFLDKKGKSIQRKTKNVINNKNNISEEESDDNNDEDDEEKEPEEDDEYAAIKEEISSLSFEELHKLKEKLGLKVFNQIMHETRAAPKQQKRVFKRENKNRPMEMSSKKQVTRFRDVIPVKKKVTRDPRFDDLSGEFNPHIFEKTYSFIGDVKSREKKILQKKIKKEKNTEKKKEMQYLLNRMKQQEVSEQQKQKKSDIEKEWKKKEKEMVKDGKMPYYLKKADIRKLELAEKYKELKKSGKVDNYLSKKRKKTAQKEKRLLPTKI